MAEYRIGVRIGHGAQLIVGIIVRSADYYYIDHRSAEGLVGIADRFGKGSVEWFDVLSGLNRLIESGADLTPLGDVYMESPWQAVTDTSSGHAVGAYFERAGVRLRVSLESVGNSADYVIVANAFVARGTVARDEVAQMIAHVRRRSTRSVSGGDAAATGDRPVPMIEAIDEALTTIRASGDPDGVQPVAFLDTALSSLLGYEGWATPPVASAAVALSQ
ncbi:hypothetical protein [Sphingomonas sp. SUN039]|uniref:hypothetical protein n=1 Tax=Sphingomonas sp. SUN039 TaxID=2937787 RepID=UPI002164A335|nr:hypothetical protein [Sphingomonas sp. SUN039]UVO55325.1 hypothetical protein M0209_14765 [Sphingomonas sp. SUN039]